MNFFQFISLYKMMCALNNPILRNQMTHNDFDLACEALKNIADHTNNWTDADRARYKALVDFVNEMAKQNNYQV